MYVLKKAKYCYNLNAGATKNLYANNIFFIKQFVVAFIFFFFALLLLTHTAHKQSRVFLLIIKQIHFPRADNKNKKYLQTNFIVRIYNKKHFYTFPSTAKIAVDKSKCVEKLV